MSPFRIEPKIEQLIYLIKERAGPKAQGQKKSLQCAGMGQKTLLLISLIVCPVLSQPRAILRTSGAFN